MCLCVPVAFCFSGVILILQYPYKKMRSVYKKCFPEKNVNYTVISANNSKKTLYPKRKI
jgi:hypothetical protein